MRFDFTILFVMIPGLDAEASIGTEMHVKRYSGAFRFCALQKLAKLKPKATDAKFIPQVMSIS